MNIVGRSYNDVPRPKNRRQAVPWDYVLLFLAGILVLLIIGSILEIKACNDVMDTVVGGTQVQRHSDPGDVYSERE